ncbi:MAG: hypothetical protein RUMPE_00554 [Eubacteriales bacterium SKADARSKE-1]|nr:hypothetical protein [Eubacteriales bacterium SKADARSKE-1]
MINKKLLKKSHRQLIFILCITLVLLFSGILLIVHSCSNNKNDILQENQQNESSKINNSTPTATATVGSVGDILLHNPVLRSCYNSTNQTYDFGEIFSFFSPYIKKLDYSVANLECSISSSQWGYSGYPQFKSPESIVDAVQKAGFKMLLTANNHANDGGARGVFHTIDVIKQKNADFIGSKDDVSVPPYLVKEVNGIKFGMINYTFGQFIKDGLSSLNGIPLDKKASSVVNVFDYNKLDLFYSQMETAIKNMKNDGAQAIILYIHWGNEYELKPNKYQTEIAKKMCDLGVDVIVGGHPHVVQPVDMFTSSDGSHKMFCIYSVGNIVSNQRIALMNLKTGNTEDGVLFTTTFTKFDDGKVTLTDVNVLPTWMQLCNISKKQYKIIPLDKSVDWNKDFNLGQDMQNAQKSYNRTMALVSEGIQKFKENKVG